MVAQRTIEPGMFADSLLETSWSQRSRRSWTTLTSFSLEALAIGLLLLIPILKTVGLPPAHPSISTPVSMSRPAPMQVTESVSRAGSTSAPTQTVNVIHLPTQRNYSQIGVSVEDPGPPPTGPIGSGLGDRTGPGIPGIDFGPSAQPMPVAPPKPITRAIRTSSMQAGNLIHRVTPTYSQIARSGRVQGAVVLSAIISKEGTIENLQVLSGHPLLVPSAIEAVRQWRYRPYILNGDPVEVETQITVNFTLGG